MKKKLGIASAVLAIIAALSVFVFTFAAGLTQSAAQTVALQPESRISNLIILLGMLAVSAAALLLASRQKKAKQ